MDEHPIALSIKNLSKKYSSRSSAPYALKDVSLELPVGKVCCLLGPNGSGKTTLLKILADLIQPTEGSILINGIDPAMHPMQARRNIGWMPAEERSGFYGRLTGRENLEFFGALQGLKGESLDRIIGNLALQIGIGEEMDQMILKDSSGTKQKIGLTRSLLHNPSILLLDEPTRNLDPHTIVRVRRLIKDLLARIEKRSILLSTHLLDEVRRVADIIVILNQGRIIRTVTAKELEKELKGTTIEDYYMKIVDEGEKL